MSEKKESCRILVCTTGGTICTSVGEGGKNDIDVNASSMLLMKKYRELAVNYPELDGVSFETIRPLETLSENMTVSKWNILIEALGSVDYSGVSGVIILHGTDTLHLTAPLMARLFENTGIPVMLVSSHRTLTDPEANGPVNLLNAVRLITAFSQNGIDVSEQSVYVTYRNMDGISYIHKASQLEECGDFSEDFFSSGMQEFDRFYETSFGEPGASQSQNERNTESDIRNSEKISERIRGYKIDEKKSVLLIKPYVGINYDLFSLDNVKAVMHLMYHSSTINSEGDGPMSAVSLCKRCKKKNIPFYIFPCDEESYRYVSTKTLLDHGAVPLSEGTWNKNLVDVLLSIH